MLHLICYPAGVPSSIGGLVANSNDMETVHEAASRILQVSGVLYLACKNDLDSSKVVKGPERL